MSEYFIFFLGSVTGATLVLLGIFATFQLIKKLDKMGDTPPPSPTPRRKNQTETELLAPIAQNKATVKFKTPEKVSYEKEKGKLDRMKELIGK